MKFYWKPVTLHWMTSATALKFPVGHWSLLRVIIYVQLRALCPALVLFRLVMKGGTWEVVNSTFKFLVTRTPARLVPHLPRTVPIRVLVDGGASPTVRQVTQAIRLLIGPKSLSFFRFMSTRPKNLREKRQSRLLYLVQINRGEGADAS